MRITFSFIAALMVVMGLYVGMYHLTASPNVLPGKTTQANPFEFSRVKKDSATQRKTREKPVKPKLPRLPLDMPVVKVKTVARTMPDSLAISTGLDLDLALDNAVYSGDFNADNFKGNEPLTPLFRVEPRYPRRALKRGIEGNVMLRLSVSAKGLVESIEVVSSEPAGVFDRSAITAVKNWKFKPKVENGKAVQYTFIQPLRFTITK